MKFKSLGIGFLGLTMICALFSCGNENNHQVHLDNPKDYIDQNLIDQEDENKKERLKINYQHQIDLDDYTIVSEAHRESGILVLKNEAGYVGFYSLTHSKFIINCQYYYEWLNYEIQDTIAGSFIAIDYENEQMIIDNNGNYLYQGSELANLDSWHVEAFHRIGHYYIDVTIGFYTNHYRYESDGKLTRVQSIPEDLDLDIDVDSGYHKGDLFKDDHIIDLTEFGQEDYYLQCSEAGHTTLFYKNDVPIQSFNVPNNSTPILTSNAIYYQKVYPLSEDNLNFAFYQDDTKYALSTYKIDMFTGIETEIEYNYLITDFVPFKDVSNYYKYSLVNLKEINGYKTLDSTITYLLDGELVKLGDYTGIHPEAFIKLNNGNYFNLKTEILYNSAMNPITYLHDMNPVYYKNHNLFLGEKDGYKGLVDSNGKVVLPFDYRSIYLDEDYNNAILVDKDNRIIYYDLAIQNNIKIYNDAQLRVIDYNACLFTIEIDDSVVFLDLNKILNSFEFTTHRRYVSSFVSNPGSDCQAMNIKYADEDGNTSYFVFYYGSSKVSFEEQGTIEEVTPMTGRSYEDAITIKTGTNMVHANPDGGLTYVKLEHPVSGFYEPYDEEHLNYLDVREIFVEDAEGEIREYQNYWTSDLFFLCEDYNYYFKIDITGYEEFDLYLNEEIADIEGQENLSVITDAPIYRIFKTNEISTYYKIDGQNVKFSIYEYNKDADLIEYVTDVHYYDDGVVFNLDESSTYIFALDQVNLYDETIYSFNEYIDVIADYVTDEDIVINPNTHVLRKFTPENNTNILLNRYDLAGVYYYDEETSKLEKVYMHYNGDEDYIELDAGVTYYIDLVNIGEEVKTVRINEVTNIEKQEDLSSATGSIKAGRSLEVTQGGYYYIGLNNLDCEIYLRENNRCYLVDSGIYYYDDGIVVNLSADSIYLIKFLESNKEIQEASYTFDAYTNVIKNYNDNKDLTIAPESHVLRKASIGSVNSASYIINSDYLKSIYYMTENGLSSVSITKYDGFSMATLDPNNTYYFDFYNSTAQEVKETIVIGSARYDLIDDYEFGVDQHLSNQKIYLKKIAPTKNMTIYYQSYDSNPSNFYIKEYNEETNITTNIYTNQINGKSVFNLSANKKYLVYYNYYSSYEYTFRLVELSIDELITLDPSVSYTGTRAFKYSPSETGYYQFRVNGSYSNGKIYGLNSANGSYEVLEKEPTHNAFYKLDASKKYVIYAYNSYNYSYKVELKYLGNDINKIQGFDISIGSFTYDASSQSYISNNKNQHSSSTYMEITANFAGTITFDYTVSSESGYDYMYVYINGNTQLQKSGVISQTASLNVIANDVIKIKYQKDSTGSQNEDRVIIKNINFTFAA